MFETEGAECAARVIFATYDPPRPGLPWLSVCLHPDGRVIASLASDTRDEAEAETKRCAAEYMQGFQERRALH